MDGNWRTILILFLFFSCAKNVIKKPIEPTSGKFKIEVTNLSGFTEAEKEIFIKVASKTERIVKSESFKSAVLNFSFNGENKFHYTSDTPSKVYENSTQRPWLLDYRKEWLWNKSTIAYTTPQISYVVINSRQFKNLSEAKLSANICHEIGGHKIGGYEHETKWNKDRDYSVPYALGSICEKEYLRGE